MRPTEFSPYALYVNMFPYCECEPLLSRQPQRTFLAVICPQIPDRDLLFRMRARWEVKQYIAITRWASNVMARNVICRDQLSLTRASLGARSDRFRWGEAKGRAEGSGQVRRIGEARVHGGCPHQFTGSYLARGMLER
jgi:hypothetical protein